MTLIGFSTSGLDASIALSVMQVLRDIAATGRTVIGASPPPHLTPRVLLTLAATIHQPRSDIWQLADNVTLLAKGGVVAVRRPIVLCRTTKLTLSVLGQTL